MSPCKLDTLEEMDKFLESNKLPRQKQDKIHSFNAFITSTEIERVHKSLPQSKDPGRYNFSSYFCQTSKEDLILKTLKKKKKKEEGGHILKYVHNIF